MYSGVFQAENYGFQMLRTLLNLLIDEWSNPAMRWLEIFSKIPAKSGDEQYDVQDGGAIEFVIRSSENDNWTSQFLQQRQIFTKLSK